MRHPHVASFPASVIGRRNHEVRGAFLTCCSIWSLSPPFIFACVAILWLPSSSYAHAHLGVISLTNKSFLNRNGPFGFRAFAHNDTFISADDTTHPDSVPSGSSYGLTVAHNIKFSGVPVTHDAFFLYVPSKHGTPRTAAVNAFESSAEEGEDAAVKAAALAAADLSWGSCSAFCDGGRQQWNRTLAMNEAMAGIRTVATKADEAELKGVVVAALEGKYGRDEWRQCHAFPCGALADQAKLDMVAAKTGAAPLLGRNLAAAMVDGDCGVYVELELDEACREKLLLLEITTDTWELLLGMNNHAGLFGAPPIRGAPQNDGLRSGSKREPASAGTPQDTAAGVDASTVTAESRPSVRATAEGLDSDDAGATLQLDQLMSGLSFSSCLTLCQFRDDCAAIIYKGDPAELARVKDHSEGVETIRNASHAERTSDVRQPQRHSAVSVCQLIKSMSLPLCFKPVMSEPVLSSSASFLSHLPVPSILVVKGAALTLCSPVLEDQISRVKSQVDQLEKQWKGTKEQSMNREREAREEAANQTPLAAARFRLLALESMRKLLQIRVSDGGPVEAGKQEEGEVVSQGGGRVVAREALWGTKSLLPLSTNSVDTDVWRSQVALPLSPACPAFQWVRLYAGAGCAMPLLVREVSLGAERNGSWQASQQVVSRRRGLRKLPHGALELHRGAQGLLPKNEETTTKQARLKPIETVSNNSPSPSGDPKSQFDRTGEKATTLALLQMKRTETNAEHSMMPAADDTKQARAAGVSSRETRNGDAEKGGPVMPRATRATDASPEGKLASSSFSPLILSPLDMAPKHHEDGIRGALTAVRPTKSRTRQKEVLPFRQADHSDDNGASTTRSSEGAPDTDNTGSVRKESKPSGAHSSPPGVDFMGTPQLNVTDTTPPASESDLKGWRECYALLMRLVARQQMLKAVPVPEEQGVAGNYWLSEEDSDIQDVLDRVSAFSVSTKPEEVAEAKRLRGIIRAYRQGEAALFASYDLVRENCSVYADEIRDRMQSKDTANERHRGFSQVLADSRGTASSDSARALSQRALRATEVKAKTKRIMGARKRSRHVLQAEIPCIGVACQEVHLEETETCDATTQCHAQVLEARDQQAQQARTAKERLDIFSEQTPPRSQTTEQQVASSSSEAADLSVEEKGRKAADGLGLADPEHKPVDGANGTFNQTAGGEANNLSPQWGDASTPSLDDITKNDLYDITDTGLRQGDGGQAVNVTFTVRPKRRSPIIKSSSHKDQETRLDVIRDAATKSALPKTQEAVHPSPSPPTLLSASQLQLGNEKLIREHYLPELGPVSNPGGASPRQTYASAAQPSTGPLNADDVELPTGENISYLNFILMTITGSLSALTCIFFCIACNKKVRLMLAVGEGALPRQEEMLEQVHRRQRGRPVPAAYPQSDASVNTSRVTSSDEKYVVDANNQPLMATACFSAGASGSTPAGTQLRTSSDSKICNAQDERLVGDWGKDLGVENLPVQRRPNCARGPWVSDMLLMLLLGMLAIP
ncbi:conserved hypothetical protein [Neospora caninum Liverpool]|uniref:Transmembrane protein n=1 Tax=Neospora caninum (strain Liverpool) TaxID=572307 RepID=F0VBJ5_NEOCL|nr:conserved hypothetical protein [Neospora caninum Liverpool]CBZ50979.1 conserved hypothetical protein [Neospora caninum Liverpool]|eukprot:XP_003881012.1 conserved hypothetical protein [Neospora caninum Liverpool]